MATAKTQTTKTGNTVEATGDVKFALPDAKRGLYSAVGAADYAVAQLRAIPRYQGAVVEALRSQVADLQKLPQNLRAQLNDLQGKVNETYGEFADRGEKLVSGIRKDPATQAAVEQTKTAKSQVKAARTSVKKAAAGTGAATEAAGDKIG
ncbi:hypothetical protein [Cryptosporangium arvum]|uniref:Heparin binding hemagglutinin HbhA n=1 Tax=Cryptosporangium arvum DSM 44712 TaxID=927661 RepID=A0A010YGI4_9ACTN|nr:hypothetical protein [Cryptosporangium arvum]EXG79355.1 hypothetical protein CryarDRAFT_0390 [Cryptosporangium arvum DSM 44712]